MILVAFENGKFQFHKQYSTEKMRCIHQNFCLKDLTFYYHHFSVNQRPKRKPKYTVDEFNRLIVKKQKKMKMKLFQNYFVLKTPIQLSKAL